MNAPLSVVQRDAMNARERRMRRATLARRLRASMPQDTAAIDWNALDAAPEWLGLPEEQLVQLQRAVGAVLHAAELRLWIDAAGIAAVRAALGEQVWQAVLRPGAGRTFAVPPVRGRLDPTPYRIGESLARAGAGVLLAALPAGPLRNAAASAFAPAAAAEMVDALAASLVAKAQALIDSREEP